ncbi:MAG: hypothetical protein P794_03140 [Epsilonproteobacteria bacterium (ex Lamellibrachia satsuma)]|nr:MAG: hypothetical protein P794_03140 [Epsilonproteobacteria bacterium (ex Lamellibrachia satsuma)]
MSSSFNLSFNHFFSINNLFCHLERPCKRSDSREMSILITFLKSNEKTYWQSGTLLELFTNFIKIFKTIRNHKLQVGLLFIFLKKRSKKSLWLSNHFAFKGVHHNRKEQFNGS